eukprot:6853418-Prorocentrum_lima.AAC.1
MVVESVRKGEERRGNTPGEAARKERRISNNEVNAAGGVEHMSVRRRRRRELRGDEKEVVLQEEVGKKMAVHGGARLRVGFVFTHEPGVISAGEPAVGIDAKEEPGAKEGAKVGEECGVILRRRVLHGS